MTWLSQLFGFFRAFQLWVVVAPWESGLRIRLGKTSEVLHPGPHWRIPFLDRIFVQPVRLRTISDSGQTMATKDGKVLTLAVAVSYAIGDIQQLYSTVSNPEVTLLYQVQGLIAKVVANATSTEISPGLIEQLVTERMPASAWGLRDVSLMVTSFAFVRTFRLLNYDYRNVSKTDELDHHNG